MPDFFEIFTAGIFGIGAGITIGFKWVWDGIETAGAIVFMGIVGCFAVPCWFLSELFGVDSKKSDDNQ